MAAIRTSTAYGVVADNLRRRIARGEFEPGQRLPTETELCRSFSTSRITVRRAMAILEDERLVRRRAGSGTFVNRVPARKITLLNCDFTGSITRDAPLLRRRLAGWSWRAAPAVIADLMGERRGDRVLFARRIDMLKRRPAAYDEAYLTAGEAAALAPDDLARLDFIERWREVSGIRLTRIHQSLEAVAAGSDQARWLHVVPGAPLLKEVSTYFDAAGEPAGVFVTWYRHDLFRVASTAALS